MLVDAKNRGTGLLDEKYVAKHRSIVERFKRFSLPEYGITESVNVFEAMAAKAGADKVESMNPFQLTKTAIIMQNFVNKSIQTLDETSRASLPTWIKNGLALIAITFAEDIVDQVISVQPMANRKGLVHYLDIITEAQKGNINAGTRLFSALQGFRGTENYSSEKVTGEPIGAAGATDYNPTLGYRPIIPGTFTMTDGVLVIRDDRNGNLIGDIAGGGPTNTINYISGVVDARFSAPTVGPVVANYEYNIEAALLLPEYGIVLRQESVEARPRALGATWSQQAVFDFLNDFGIDAEPTIIDAGARIIQMETFKHVVNFLRNIAAGGSVVFDNAPPSTAVPYTLHIKTFSFYVSRLQNLIWERTQTVRPNVLIISPDVWFIVAAQDGFEGVTPVANDGVAGPRKIGTLTRHGITVFADPTFVNQSGVLTYRGPEFVSTAAVMGMYIPLYKSPVHVRGFRKDVALLSEYALHAVNTAMVGTLSVINL